MNTHLNHSAAPETNRKWLILLTVAVNGLILILDMSIVNISYPELTRIFHTEPSVVLWVTVGYALVLVGLMPIVGKIGDVYGRKKVFLFGYILFTLGLILCSLSQTIQQLILARIVQGIGGAMNMALGFALVTDAFPTQDRGKALGVMTSVFAIGPLMGFTLGGIILDAMGWRAIFYTRVPVCLIGILMVWTLLKENKPLQSGRAIDYLGAVTLFGSLTCLLLYLNLGSRSEFTSGPALVLGSAAVLLFVIFFIQEKKCRQPLVDLALFKNGLFTGGSLSLLIYGVAQSTNMFLFPYFAIDGLGYSAAQAGLAMAAIPLMMMIGAPLSGWLSDQLGSRVLCTVGLILFGLAFFLLSRLNAEADRTSIILRLLLLGCGATLFNSPNTSLLMGTAPKDNLGSVSGLITTTRQIGISAGIAISGMIYTLRKVYYAARMAAEHADPAVSGHLTVIHAYTDTVFIAMLMILAAVLSSALIGRDKLK